MVLDYGQDIGMYFDLSHLVHITIDAIIFFGFNERACQQRNLYLFCFHYINFHRYMCIHYKRDGAVSMSFN